MVNKNECLLALDASSKVIGFSIFDLNTKQLLKIDKFLHDDKKTLIERVLEYEKLLLKLKEEYNITEMVIEEAFKAFTGGGSSATTVQVLTAINFGYQLITTKNNVKVTTLTVNEARKNCFPGVKIRTLAKMRKQKEKDFCFDLTLPTLKSYYTTKTISKGKNKGNVVYEEWCKDMADSWIVGTGYLAQKK